MNGRVQRLAIVMAISGVFLSGLVAGYMLAGELFSSAEAPAGEQLLGKWIQTPMARRSNSNRMAPSRPSQSRPRNSARTASTSPTRSAPRIPRPGGGVRRYSRAE